MRIQNNLRRVLNFIVNQHKDIFHYRFWDTVGRVLKERFSYLDRIGRPEFLYNLRQIESRPWNLHIELTNICNANCIFCAYHLQSRKQMIMGKAVYSKALGDYCALGGGELRLETCLGDPLVDPDFIERIQQARSHPEITRIITLTNGINLDRIGIDNILDSGIDQINISTGPWEENLYASIYRSKDYIRMRNNVVELLKNNSKRPKRVEVKILFRSNLSMSKTLSLPDYKMIEALPHEVEFNTDFDTWLGNIKQNDLIPGMHLRPLAKPEKEPCYWLYDGPIVFSDGKVGLCGCRDFNADSELIIGDISKDSLLDLWHSEKADKLRKKFWNGNFPYICSGCSAYANLDYYRSKRGSLRASLVNKWLKAKKNG